jgi:CheY-like chemotaxis protein
MATVLIVDDYAPNLVALECALEPLHQSLVRARSGEEALTIAATTDVALIVTDLRMDGMSGADLITCVREGARNRDVPIIVLSATDLDDPVLRRALQKAVLFVQKPFRPQGLREQVMEALGSVDSSDLH